MIFLSACGPQQASNTIPPKESAQPNQELPETSAAPPVQATPEVTPTGPSVKVSYEVVLPNGLLPQTNFEPSGAPPRRYGETTHTIIPQPDYGRIWPYIGGFAAQMWMLGEIYGLCDAEGQIICDPVFNEVRILERDGKLLYMLTKNQADEEWKDISTITLAKTDGSWAKEFDDVIYDCMEEDISGEWFSRWRKSVVYEYITVCENGKWGVIDYDGNEILPCTYNAPVCFSDGLASVLAEDGKTYSFISKTGSIVIGPYDTPPLSIDSFFYWLKGPMPLNHGMLFCEGLARFYENGKFGIIDRAGNVIIPAQYNFISSYSNGTALFFADEKMGILDKNGKVLFEFPKSTWIYRNEDGEVILEEQNGRFVLDLTTGELTRKYNGNGDIISWSSSTNGVVIQFEEGELKFPEGRNVVLLGNGNIALSSRNNTWEIMNRNGEPVAGPFDGCAEYARDGFIYVYDGVSYLNLGYEARYLTLYDITGKRVLPDMYRSIMPFGGRYLVRQDYNSGLLDENGNWVITVPLYDYMGD